MRNDIVLASITQYYTEGPQAGASVSMFCDNPPEYSSRGEKKQFLIRMLVEKGKPTGLYSLDLSNITTGKDEQIKIWFERR